VLVVDDDPALRGLLVEYLGASGFTVDTAADDRQMRECMRQAWPDADQTGNVNLRRLRLAHSRHRPPQPKFRWRRTVGEIPPSGQ
jgi:DNA-binding response OmpR family regulator